MLVHVIKPAELVDGPPDGSYFATRVAAPSNLDFRLGEIVKIVNSQATKLSGNEDTGFYMVVKDNSPGLPEGSFVDNPGGSWFAKRPDYIDVVPVSGRRVIMTYQGTLASSILGTNRRIITTPEGFTVVTPNPAASTAGARVIEVVEGRVGDTNPRVLVELF